jgi:transposase, IS5 family
MLVDRYESDKFFQSILHLTQEMDPVLAQIDHLLDDDRLYQAIRADLAKRYPHTEQTGHPSTPVEVILRMLVVKRLYRLSYEQTEYQVRDSLVLRQFCRLYLNEAPDDTTLIRWAQLIQPETLETFNTRLVGLATQLQFTRGRKLRTDGTVVETHIHPPSDSSLLADGVRVLGRTLRRAQTVLRTASDETTQTLRGTVRQARQLARQIGEAARKHGETATTQLQGLYQRLVDLTQQTLTHSQAILPALQQASGKTAQRLARTLTTFVPRVAQVIAQTQRRVLQGEAVPAADKLVSLFEAHTDIIRRNKAGHPTEYGHKVWLDQVEGGLVTRWKVLEGNAPDTDQWPPSLEAHQQLFEHPPEQASADRGVFSQANETFAQKMGVEHIILPKPGYCSAERQAWEGQDWFQKGRAWHAGIEGCISGLKRGQELTRCRDHGRAGFEKWVGWGVIAANLKRMGRAVVAKM